MPASPQDADCVPIAAEDVDALITFATDNHIEFVVVGPEAPLVAGLVDRLAAIGIKAFGPSAAAAMMEGSKGFMKDFCARHAIPTAGYGRGYRDGAGQGLYRPTGRAHRREGRRARRRQGRHHRRDAWNKPNAAVDDMQWKAARSARRARRS